MSREKLVKIGRLVSAENTAACTAADDRIGVTELPAMSRISPAVNAIYAVAREVNRFGFNFTWLSSWAIKVAVICNPLLALVLAGARTNVYEADGADDADWKVKDVMSSVKILTGSSKFKVMTPVDMSMAN